MIERRARRHAQRETLRGTQTHAVGRRQWGEAPAMERGPTCRRAGGLGACFV